jgi:hypothetical protein
MAAIETARDILACLGMAGLALSFWGAWALQFVGGW